MVKFKLALIVLLASASVVLFIVKQEAPKTVEPKEVPDSLKVKRTLNPGLIDSILTAVQSEYSIPDSFYVKSKKKNRPHKFFVPEDLPLPTLENALWSKFADFKNKVAVGYNKKDKASAFKIELGDSLFSFLVVKKKGALRTTSHLSIVISGYEEADEDEKKYLREYPEPYVMLLKPTKQVQVLSKDFDDQNIPYAILVGGSDADMEFQIEDDHPKRRIETTVSGLVSAFPNASFFFSDIQSAFAGSVIFPFVKEKFDAKKKKLVKSSLFIPVEGADSSTAVLSFNEQYSKNRKRENLVFVLTPESVRWIEGEIKKLRKKGVKISGDLEIAGVKKDETTTP
ncbi:MAG: hypothetical protein AMXMBFR49_04090 [Chlorobiota bacterium]|nr:MAG: hypothetical protein EDM75_11670 [Chlorobiota bacterium]